MQQQKDSGNIKKIRELKKLWNVKVTGVSVIIGALGTVPKNLEKRLKEQEIRGRIKTRQHCYQENRVYVFNLSSVCNSMTKLFFIPFF